MRRNIFVSLGVVTVAFLLILASCRKINLPTDIGQDLIPEVDNIHTFDTTVEVQTFNQLFTAANDTFNSIPDDAQYLGLITNDPLFGKTDARLFFQLLPSDGKKTFVGAVNSRTIDSVILSLPYFETYGDSVLPQTLEVSEIAQSADFKTLPYKIVKANNARGYDILYKRDSAYSIRNNNYPLAGILGTKDVIPQRLKDSVTIIRRDTTKIANVIRIRLDNSFGQRLLGYDTTGANDGYSSDTAFNMKFKGFAIKSTSGNAVLGVMASNASMRVYYRYADVTSGVKDTTATFGFMIPTSAYANYIGRDYSGTQLQATSGDNTADQILYLQNMPGSYALLKIPALAGMSNRIIHLAQLQAESIYDPSDTSFYAPNLFIDPFTNRNGQNFNLPYVFSDYILQNPAGITPTALALFGSIYDYKKDASNNLIKYWRFNVTRFVQNVVNRKIPSYDLRLYAKPYVLMRDTVRYEGTLLNRDSVPIIIPQSRRIGYDKQVVAPGIGRVRLGGGTHPTQK